MKYWDAIIGVQMYQMNISIANGILQGQDLNITLRMSSEYAELEPLIRYKRARVIL